MDKLAVVQCALYFLTFISGFVVAVPLGLVQIGFENKCLLYATVDFTIHLWRSTNPHNCNFGIYLQVLAGILYSLAAIVYHIFIFMKRNPYAVAKMCVLPFVLLNSLITVLVLISSGIISVGFRMFCNNFYDNNKSLFFKTCQSAQYVRWGIYGTNTSVQVQFYTPLVITQIATWSSFLLWTAQVAIGIRRLVLARRSASAGLPSSTPRDMADVTTFQPSA